jgi:hypothetical protein
MLDMLYITHIVMEVQQLQMFSHMNGQEDTAQFVDNLGIKAEFIITKKK